MFWRRRGLKERLEKTYKVKCCGVVFRIRRIDPLDFVAGSRAVVSLFDTYKTKGQQVAAEHMAKDIKRTKEHYKDVFLAAVVSPKLSRKQDTEDIFVDNLFTDWELANTLYFKIMELSYGKKKVQQFISHQTERQT